MLKTNSKKARENIRAYIIECSNCTGYDPATHEETPLAFGSFDGYAAHIWDEFKQEQMTGNARAYNLHINGTWQNCFADWLRGLPGVIDSGDWLLGYDAAKNVVARLLEESDEERDKYANDKAVDLLHSLIYREIIRAVENPFSDGWTVSGSIFNSELSGLMFRGDTPGESMDCPDMTLAETINAVLNADF